LYFPVSFDMENWEWGTRYPLHDGLLNLPSLTKQLDLALQTTDFWGQAWDQVWDALQAGVSTIHADKEGRLLKH
jgi:hypothetical protein